MQQTPTLNGQEIELFRVGNYGAKGSYTDADLQDLVSRYGSSDEAAVTAGHPKHDGEPAYGWMKSLRFANGLLYGTPGEVNPDFDHAVSVQKAFKHRSVGFSRDQNGKLHLRHVAFLGAVPPAIKGLKPAVFSSDPYEEFAFSEGDDMTEQEQNKSIREAIVAFFSEKFGGKTTETIDVKAVAAEAAAAVEAKFSAELKTEREARQAVEATLAEQKKQFSAGTTQNRVAAAITELKAAGSYVPAFDKLHVPELFSALAGVETKVEFSDAEGKAVKEDAFTTFSTFMKGLGKIVPAEKIAAGQQAAEVVASQQANGVDVDPASATFSEMVNTRMKEKGVLYTEAYRQLVSEGKKPEAGASTGGAV